MADAAARWSRALASWAIPQEIMDRAPESPWHFSAPLFARVAQRSLDDPVGGPSRRRAREALPDGGTVLDVGAGGGAASLPLAPPAALLTAVDESPEMLAAFATGAAGRGVRHQEAQGRWPDVAGSVEPADVVVCHHVLYNVPDLVPFAAALTAKARRRVVVEISERHPQSNLNHLWKAIHGIDRPTSPVASDAIEVLREMGLDVADEASDRGALWDDTDRSQVVEFTRRRLCLGPERDDEIARLLGPPDAQPGRRLVTLWWPGSAAS